jgi:ribosomal protein S18 acetylase RimI-like enzyme
VSDEGFDRGVRVALAEPGEGEAAAALGELAITGDSACGQTPSRGLAAAIDHHGGSMPLPYGRGRCWVARLEKSVTGMVYATPPIRWLQELPQVQRGSVTRSLVEIELLAVGEAFRHQGIGTALLNAVESAARDEGTHLALAKVRTGAFPVMRWYRRRGYVIAAQNEPVVFGTRHGFMSCDDGSDGYQLAVKALQAGEVVRRTGRAAESMLVLKADS